MNKWKKWRENQDAKTLAYLDSQPIWRDKDLFKAVSLGIAIGIAIGFAWGYAIGLPDYTSSTINFVRG